jgi:hypothetical protein
MPTITSVAVALFGAVVCTSAVIPMLATGCKSGDEEEPSSDTPKTHSNHSKMGGADVATDSEASSGLDEAGWTDGESLDEEGPESSDGSTPDGSPPERASPESALSEGTSPESALPEGASPESALPEDASPESAPRDDTGSDSARPDCWPDGGPDSCASNCTEASVICTVVPDTDTCELKEFVGASAQVACGEAAIVGTACCGECGCVAVEVFYDGTRCWEGIPDCSLVGLAGQWFGPHAP